MAASWPFWFPRPVGSSSVGGSGSAALCVWRFIDVEREREDVPLFRVFMSGKSWRHLSFETLPENGHRAYRTKVRTNDGRRKRGHQSKTTDKKCASLQRFLSSTSYVYILHIYIFFSAASILRGELKRSSSFLCWRFAFPAPLRGISFVLFSYVFFLFRRPISGTSERNARFICWSPSWALIFSLGDTFLLPLPTRCAQSVIIPLCTDRWARRKSNLCETITRFL